MFLPELRDEVETLIFHRHSTVTHRCNFIAALSSDSQNLIELEAWALAPGPLECAYNTSETSRNVCFLYKKHKNASSNQDP